MKKILIGYDGSSFANAALVDLQHAGLPNEVEAIVMSIADVWLPPESIATHEPMPGDMHPTVVHARQRANEVLEEAVVRSVTAAQQLRKLFPTWKIHSEACSDSPTWALVKKAQEWDIDLVMLGSHGRTGFERVLIGSVSQTVAANAVCSVRVGRASLKQADEPLKLLVGYDGSGHADAAVDEVASRHWPKGSQAKLMVAIDSVIATASPWHVPGFLTWSLGEPDGSFHGTADWVQKMADKAAEKLRMAGLETEVVINHGDPKEVLVEQAEAWMADCIFVGARGLSRFERILMGSVSTAVVSRAVCTVEVVRRK